MLSHLNLSLAGFVASTTKNILSLFGTHFEIIGTNLVNNSMDVEVNELCTGITEMAVIFAAIMASYDVNIKKRIYGVLFGFLMILLVNPIRISATIIAFQKNEIFGAIMHDLLFRLSLIIIVLVYYMVWYNVSVKK